MTPYNLKSWTDTTRNDVCSSNALLIATNKCNSVKEHWSSDTLLSSNLEVTLAIQRRLHFLYSKEQIGD